MISKADSILKIRPYALEDAPQLVSLFEEMQRHYGVRLPPTAEIVASLEALPDGAQLLLAETDTLVGFLAFSPIYPGPGLRAGLFMKELFVSQHARGRGVGKALMRALARMALTRGFARIDWTADRHNHRLRQFYSEFGAQTQEEKIFFRLSGDALARNAAED